MDSPLPDAPDPLLLPGDVGRGLKTVAARMARLGGWSIDALTRELTWTDEVFRMHDLEPGEAPAFEAYLRLYEPEARPVLAQAVEEGLRTGGPLDLELPLRSATGRHTWVSIQGEALRQDGRIVRLVGAIQDVTERRRQERRLRDAADRYRGIFTNAADPILLIGLDGRVRDANLKACEVYGYAREEFIGLSGREFVHPEHQHKFAAALASILAGRPYTVESVDVRKGGEPFPIEVHISPFVHEGEKAMLCSIRDIGERRRNETRMREALAVFNASSQAIMTTDAAGTIVSVNPAFTAITGYSAEEVVGRKPSLLSSGRHDRAFYESMWNALTTVGHWEGEVWNRRRDGEIYAQWQTVNSVRDHFGRVVEYVALFSDITQRKQQEAAVWRQANFDTLTGLANRSLFQDRLERAIAAARRNGTRLGVLFLDLDAFKWINDTLGHDVGDQLLVEVARRLRSCVRERDTVARLGGDEFTILVHDVADVDDLRAIGEKTIGVLREPFVLAGTRHYVTGSAGITVFPEDGMELQALLRNADIAMYKSKQAGRNRCYFYAPKMQAEAAERLRTESELREGLRSGAFTLYYQPVVDADSGELVGAEALLRWQHPQRGLLEPAQFLAVAEDCGVIAPLGEWVLREAAMQWRRWRADGPPTLKLVVNLSTVQFRAAGLVEAVSAVVDEFGFEPGELMLDIDEVALASSHSGVETTLPRLEALGIRVTLDRFGVGPTSLANLKRFPIGAVKVDRSFLEGCPGDRTRVHMIEAIVQMAHTLGLRVAACGVETEEQRDLLRDLGCDSMQGHLFGRPVGAEAFEALVKRRHMTARGDGSSPEQRRLLAALRQEVLDIDQWLRRLVAEQSAELAVYLEARRWTSRGLDLRAAVAGHLHCRRRLTDLAFERPDREPGLPHCNEAGKPCMLGDWVARVRAGGDTRFEQLAGALNAYHRLASQIVADCRQGYHDSARRSLASLKFRAASRDVVLALVEGFKDAGQSGLGPLVD